MMLSMALESSLGQTEMLLWHENWRWLCNQDLTVNKASHDMPEVYEGGWQNGKRHGKATFVTPSPHRGMHFMRANATCRAAL